MRLLIVLVIFPFWLQAKNLRAVPDENLRNKLRELGHVTNDSLDLNKIKGQLMLDLRRAKIHNLNGLQHYEQVWHLLLDGNEIRNLDHLPPNLRHLSCSNNRISRISDLPEKLAYLECSRNEIAEIESLPHSLVTLIFSHNRLTHFPQIPRSLGFINFMNNPINVDSVPESFEGIVCDSPDQNCLPNDWVQLNVLGEGSLELDGEIVGLTVVFNSNFSLGIGSKEEIREYHLADSMLISKRNRIKQKINKGHKRSYQRDRGRNVANYVDPNELYQIVNDLSANNLIFEVKSFEHVDTIDLRKVRNGICSIMCDDCSSYLLTFRIFSQSDTLVLNYHFDSTSDYFFCRAGDYVKLPELVEWLYVYRLVSLALPNHEFLSSYFSREKLLEIKRRLK